MTTQGFKFLSRVAYSLIFALKLNKNTGNRISEMKVSVSKIKRCFVLSAFIYAWFMILLK